MTDARGNDQFSDVTKMVGWIGGKTGARIVIAIDPGPSRSALVCYDPVKRCVLESMHTDNNAVLAYLSEWNPDQALAIEMVASYGMPVGKEVFETCVWIGRFIQAWLTGWMIPGDEAKLVYRKDVRMHLCGSMRANDGNVRTALIDRFGGRKARGTKRRPGPLYGIAGDKWAALAVAVTYSDDPAGAETVSMDGLQPR